MKAVKLYKDGEPYTLVFVPSHLAGFLRFSVLIEGALVELEARMVDPNIGRPVH